MATLDEARTLVLELPDVTEGTRYGRLSWSVGGRTFAWERAFSKADIRRYGDEPVPEPPILALATGDLAEKEALLAEHPEFFTIPHFDGYAAVLLRLGECFLAVVRDSLLDAWLVCAPPEVARAYLAEGGASD